MINWVFPMFPSSFIRNLRTVSITLNVLWHPSAVQHTPKYNELIQWMLILASSRNYTCFKNALRKSRKSYGCWHLILGGVKKMSEFSECICVHICKHYNHICIISSRDWIVCSDISHFSGSCYDFKASRYGVNCFQILTSDVNQEMSILNGKFEFGSF